MIPTDFTMRILFGTEASPPLPEQIHAINQRLDSIMATLDEVLAEVSEQRTAIDSVLALLSGLQQQLADALSGVTLPEGVQEKIDSVFAAVNENTAALEAALATPAEPEPVVEPEPGADPEPVAPAEPTE